MPIVVYELVGADRRRPFSPHCWKAVMALAHKGIDLDRVPVTFTEVPSVEGGASKTVPVIRDGATVVSDSFAIAKYLETTYPDRPTLFGGPGGEALARFVERWSQTIVHPYLGAAALTDIHAGLAPVDQAYFRASREARYGKALEQVSAGRDTGLAAFRAALEPLRSTLAYQTFIGGHDPLFADYIVFGALQWVRITSPYRFVEVEEPIASWFERCLDLHGGLGRGVPAAA